MDELYEGPTGMKAPFPYFGGKRQAARIVWERFGDCRNYVEPFAGSAAMLLNRPPGFRGPETINDIDGMVANFWRAVRFSPHDVAHHADWPVNENDLHARHAWLVGQKESLRGKLEGDPEWHDPRVAGWWAWGACAWIGSGWCSGAGPWSVVDGELKRAGRGVNRNRPHLSDDGNGVNRLTNTSAMFDELSARLRNVRVTCGSWDRVVSNAVLAGQKHWKPCGVFLDPPYGATRSKDLYAYDCVGVYRDVHAWAIAHGNEPWLRICVAGFDGEFPMPEGWTEVAWGHGGRGKQCATGGRERLWFSPHCLVSTQTLFNRDGTQCELLGSTENR